MDTAAAWLPGTPVGVLALSLAHEDVAADQRAGGSPQTGWRALGSVAGWEVGVWEMTVGAMTDVEADEVFVVVAGAAVLEVHGSDDDPTGTSTRSDLRPGDVVRLTAGMRTTWTVTEPLRKVYLTPVA